MVPSGEITGQVSCSPQVNRMRPEPSRAIRQIAPV